MWHRFTWLDYHGLGSYKRTETSHSIVFILALHLFVFVGDDDSGPHDVVIWILSARAHTCRELKH